MDEATKLVIAGWIRHLIGIAAGAWGLETWLSPDLMNAIITICLALIALGWSTLSNRIKASTIDKLRSELMYDPERNRG